MLEVKEKKLITNELFPFSQVLVGLYLELSATF